MNRWREFEAGHRAGKKSLLVTDTQRYDRSRQYREGFRAGAAERRAELDAKYPGMQRLVERLSA